MPTLTDYRQFDGRHWETGTVANFFNYRGVRAPHTGRPYSEALLMGVSGGAVMGYFSFAYENYPPMARILTRNTFDPWDTMLSRLGVAQNVHHTARPDRAVADLVEALEEGTPAIVWADVWSLPYNALDHDPGMWAMFPIVVYGLDETVAHIADRARVGLTCTPEELAAARGRVKKDKHRLMTLEAPDPNKLAAAVSAGIWDCIRLYTEAPPKGSKNNFGLAAFRYWAELLTKPKARLSWANVFPPGAKMLDGLTSAFTDIALFGKGEGQGADREVYADFLDEAALVLGKPALGEAAARFREAAAAWAALGATLLPEEIEPFRETRALMVRRHALFLNEGSAATSRLREIDARLAAVRQAADGDFPLTEPEVVAHRGRIADGVMRIHDVEAAAVAALAQIMAG